MEVCRKYPEDLYFLRGYAWTLEAFGDYYRMRKDTASSRAYYERALTSWNHWNKLAAPGPYVQLYIAPLQRKLTEPGNMAMLDRIIER